MRRSYFLKYITIVSIIAAMARMVFGIMMINFFADSVTFGTATPEVVMIAVWAIIVIAVSVIIQLICGFICALNWEEPTRTGTCLIWSCISLLLGLLANFLQHLTGYGVSIYVWCTGVIVPALLAIAALIFFLSVRKSKRNTN